MYDLEKIIVTLGGRKIVGSAEDPFVISEPNDKVSVSEDRFGNGEFEVSASKLAQLAVKVKHKSPDYYWIRSLIDSKESFTAYYESDMETVSGEGMCRKSGDVTVGKTNSDVTFEVLIVNAKRKTKTQS